MRVSMLLIIAFLAETDSKPEPDFSSGLALTRHKRLAETETTERKRRRRTTTETTPPLDDTTEETTVTTASGGLMKWPKKVWKGAKTAKDVVWSAVWLIFASEEEKDRVAAEKTQKLMDEIMRGSGR